MFGGLMALGVPRSAPVGSLSVGTNAAVQDFLQQMHERAGQFDAPACRTAIARQQSWSSVCQGEAAMRSDLCALEMQKWLTSNAATSASNGTRHLLYVRNQKAASQLWVNSLDLLVGAPDVGADASRLQTTRVVDQSVAERSFIFTMVREPLDTALDGYLEVRNKAMYKEEEQQFVTRLFNNTAGADSCGSQEIATEHFYRFLKALQAREPFGDEIWHVFPQAVKIDHVEASEDGQRYDAIGKVETFLADLNALRAVSGVPPMSAADLDTASEPFRHSHATQSCASVDWSDERLRRVATELYAVDYLCFNYSWPW